MFRIKLMDSSVAKLLILVYSRSRLDMDRVQVACCRSRLSPMPVIAMIGTSASSRIGMTFNGRRRSLLPE